MVTNKSILDNIRFSKPSLPSGVIRKEWRDGLLFSFPFLFGIVLFWIGPMVFSLYLVVHEWTMLSAPRFVGLANVANLFKDPLVLVSLYNTAYYTFIAVPWQLILAFLLALALNQKIRFRAAYRTIFYLPNIVPAVSTAVIWGQLFNPDYGPINNLLSIVGIQKINWFFDPNFSKPALIIMSLWGIGGFMVTFLAGLQGVPQALKEAAEIDGASQWQVFWNVTRPLISPTLFLNLIIGIIGSFQVFTASYIMTNGGPQNSTLFIVLYLYQNGFQLYRMGYAATIAWFLFLIIALLTLIQFRLANRWVFYEVNS